MLVLLFQSWTRLPLFHRSQETKSSLATNGRRAMLPDRLIIDKARRIAMQKPAQLSDHTNVDLPARKVR